MRILVTGSEGHVMRSVIPRLTSQGHTVIGVDNLIKHGTRPNDHDSSYQFVLGDLTDQAFTDALFKEIQVDGVLHGAARLYGIAGFNKYCADILHENMAMHGNVLRASANNGVKRVALISSSMIYDSTPNSITDPLVDDSIMDIRVPITDYGLSKYACERLSLSYWRQHGIEYTIWRLFNVIVPSETGDAEQGVSHVFADFIKNIVDKKMNPLPIIGDGEQVRCFTWHEDVADALADFSFGDKAKNDQFNLSNDEPITMRQLATMIHEQAADMGLIERNELAFDTVRHIANDVKARYPTSRKAKDVLGWSTDHKTDTSVRKCLEAHRARA